MRKCTLKDPHNRGSGLHSSIPREVAGTPQWGVFLLVPGNQSGTPLSDMSVPDRRPHPHALTRC